MSKFFLFFRYLYSSIYYIFTFPFFKKNYITNYIAPLSKIKNRKDIVLGKNFILRAYSQLNGDFKCGDNVRFGYGCNIFGGVEIGNNVMVAPNCLITSGSHGKEIDKGPMIFQKCPPRKKVIIGDDVWIGGNSVILPGVRIESGAIIGAGSVVVKSIPSNSIAVGNPAKVVKYRGEK